MSAEGEEAAARAAIVGEFLSHLAEERIISAAQLLLAKQALQLWRQSMTEEQQLGDAQLQQPMTGEQDMHSDAQQLVSLPQTIEAPGLILDAADNEEPLAESAAKRRRCMPSPSLLLDGAAAASPAASTEADAGEPLHRLPPQLLDHVMSLLAAELGGSSIRCTCRWLRSAFDRCNTRLVVRRAEELPVSMRGRLLDLVRCSPSVSSLTLGNKQRTRLTWPEVLEAGGQQLLQHLERLTIHKDGISDLGPLAACSRLQHLELGWCDHVQDLGPLGSCTRLQHLSLEGCSRVQDISPLAACVELQHLNMRGCHTVSSITALAACVGLQHLDMRSCNAVSDISALAACTDMQHVDLAFCREIQDFSPLAACTGLRHLILTDCHLLHDVTPLAACTGLQHLDLSGCSQVHDLAPLAACTALQRLDLVGLLYAWGRLRPGALGMYISVGAYDYLEEEEE